MNPSHVHVRVRPLRCAGLPPTPLQPLRVDVEASSVRSHLEPDSRAELSWVCTSTTHPTSPAYKHTLTLTNLQVRNNGVGQEGGGEVGSGLGNVCLCV